MLRKFISALSLACLLVIWPLIAQQEKISRADLVKAIESKDFKLAETLLQQYIRQSDVTGKQDSILQCVSLAGDIAIGLHGESGSGAELQKFVDQAKQVSNNPAFHSQLEIQVASHFANMGNYNHAYKKYEDALVYANQLPVPDPLLTAQIEYNLGVMAQRMANVSLSARHHRKAMSIRETAKTTPLEDIYLSYNAMGTIMWYRSRYDSASLFYKKALDVLGQMPENETNRFYRPSIIQNNLAGLYGAEGKVTEGIEMMKACISNTQKFIASPGLNPKKQNALSGLFEGMDNLAGLYRDIGDYFKAGDLLRYSYQQKQEKLPPGHPGVFISEILLGQHYNDIHEYDKSIQYLTSGLQKLRAAEGDFLFWEGDACYQMAMALENKKNIAEAAKYYQQSEKLFETSYEGEYDNIYLQFLRTAASFYAGNGDYSKAKSMAKRGLDYIQKVQGLESLAAFYQLLNLAELSKTAKLYNESIDYSNQGLNALNKQLALAKNLLDTVKVQVYQPKAILLKLQAQYALQEKRDTAFLRSVSLQLQEAMEILKRRRSMIDSEESINILVAENAELIEFSKQVEMELYQQTQAEIHLDKFINLHESGLYNRIRGRLDKAKLVAFEGIPPAIQEEEKNLRSAIPAALQTGAADSVLMNKYLQATNNWNSYLEKIRQQYPAYYNLRYGSPRLSTTEFQSAVAPGTSVIRYFFSGDELYALVVDQKEKKLVQLTNNRLEEKINALLERNSSGSIQGLLLQELYHDLWQPLEAAIKHEDIIIIPDGVLFALSFEMLTPKKANTFQELSSNSLLARHTISYHYSLYMIGNELPVESNDNYIAFVPGFTEEAKKNYAQAIKDSIELDLQYLSLLSQPHTIKTARNLSRLLKGQAYLDNTSTLNTFRKNAAGHKIVHIGTHAEFNNLVPERSRLIFAKDVAAGTDSNSLFLDEIYECNIKSDLAILTACESGKPGFRDGEGMISIAHAFNYAGSNSILTGLWKIDEKASSQITEIFVNNLEKGMSAALALKNAKLLYLGQAQGRTLAPAYWAGLVLIGQTPTLELNDPTNHTVWLFLAGVILLAVLILYFLQKSRNLKNSDRGR